MAKVEGSNPFIRFERKPCSDGAFCFPGFSRRGTEPIWVALVGSKRDLVDPSRIDLATARLIRAGVLDQTGGRIVQSPALERLDHLDLVCI
jgi:hypothetical protein